MKMKLNAALRAALLSCYAVAAPIASTVSTGAFITGAVVYSLTSQAQAEDDVVADTVTYEDTYTIVGEETASIGYDLFVAADANDLVIMDLSTYTKFWFGTNYDGVTYISNDAGTCNAGTIQIDSWVITNGSSGKTYTFNSTIIGDGNIELTPWSSNSANVFIFTGDMSEWSGNIITNYGSYNTVGGLSVTVEGTTSSAASGTGSISIVGSDQELTYNFTGKTTIANKSISTTDLNLNGGGSYTMALTDADSPTLTVSGTTTMAASTSLSIANGTSANLTDLDLGNGASIEVLGSLSISGEITASVSVTDALFEVLDGGSLSLSGSTFTFDSFLADGDYIIATKVDFSTIDFAVALNSDENAGYGGVWSINSDGNLILSVTFAQDLAWVGGDGTWDGSNAWRNDDGISDFTAASYVTIAGEAEGADITLDGTAQTSTISLTTEADTSLSITGEGTIINAGSLTKTGEGDATVGVAITTGAITAEGGSLTFNDTVSATGAITADGGDVNLNGELASIGTTQIAYYKNSSNGTYDASVIAKNGGTVSFNDAASGDALSAATIVLQGGGVSFDGGDYTAYNLYIDRNNTSADSITLGADTTLSFTNTNTNYTVSSLTLTLGENSKLTDGTLWFGSGTLALVAGESSSSEDASAGIYSLTTFRASYTGTNGGSVTVNIGEGTVMEVTGKTDGTSFYLNGYDGHTTTFNISGDLVINSNIFVLYGAATINIEEGGTMTMNAGAYTTTTQTGTATINVKSGAELIVASRGDTAQGALTINMAGGTYTASEGIVDADLSISASSIISSSTGAVELDSAISYSDSFYTLSLDNQTLSIGDNFSIDIEDYVTEDISYTIFTDVVASDTLLTDLNSWDSSYVWSMDGTDLKVTLAGDLAYWDAASGTLVGGASDDYSTTNFDINTNESENAQLNISGGETINKLTISGDNALTIQGDGTLVANDAVSIASDVTATVAIEAESVTVTGAEVSFEAGLTTDALSLSGGADVSLYGTIGALSYTTSDSLTFIADTTVASLSRTAGDTITLNDGNADTVSTVTIGGGAAAGTVNGDDGVTRLSGNYSVDVSAGDTISDNVKLAISGGTLSVSGGGTYEITQLVLSAASSSVSTLSIEEGSTLHITGTNADTSETNKAFYSAFCLGNWNATNVISVAGTLIVEDSLYLKEGNATITVASTGTLALAAGLDAERYTTGKTITMDVSGTLLLGDSSFASDAVITSITMQGGSTIQANGESDTTTVYNGISFADGATVTLDSGNSSSLLMSGEITGAAATANIAGSVELAGGGSLAAVTMASGANLTLSSAVSVAGTITLDSGTLALNAGSEAYTLAGTGTVSTTSFAGSVTVAEDTDNSTSLTFYSGNTERYDLSIDDDINVQSTASGSGTQVLYLSNLSGTGDIAVTGSNYRHVTLNLSMTQDNTWEGLLSSSSNIRVASMIVDSAGDEAYTMTMTQGMSTTASALDYSTLTIGNATVKFTDNAEWRSNVSFSNANATLILAGNDIEVGSNITTLASSTTGYGTVEVAMADDKTTTLSAANSSYSGVFVVTSGTLAVNHADALGTVGTVTVNGGTLSLGVESLTASDITLNGGTVLAATGTLNEAITVTADSSLAGADGSLELNSAITYAGDYSLDLSGSSVTLGEDFSLDLSSITLDMSDSYTVFTGLSSNLTTDTDWEVSLGSYDSDGYSATWTYENNELVLSFSAVSSEPDDSDWVNGDFSIPTNDEDGGTDLSINTGDTDAGSTPTISTGGVTGEEGTTTTGNIAITGDTDVTITGENDLASTGSIELNGNATVEIDTGISADGGLNVNKGNVTLTEDGSITGTDVTLAAGTQVAAGNITLGDADANAGTKGSLDLSDGGALSYSSLDGATVKGTTLQVSKAPVTFTRSYVAESFDASITNSTLTDTKVILDASTSTYMENVTLGADVSFDVGNGSSLTANNLTLDLDTSDYSLTSVADNGGLALTVNTFSAFGSDSTVTLDGTVLVNLELSSVDYASFESWVTGESTGTLTFTMTGIDSYVDGSLLVLTFSDNGNEVYYYVWGDFVTTGATGGSLVVELSQFNVIPEPSTATLSLLALAGLLARRRRSRTV